MKSFQITPEYIYDTFIFLTSTFFFPFIELRTYFAFIFIFVFCFFLFLFSQIFFLTEFFFYCFIRFTVVAHFDLLFHGQQQFSWPLLYGHFFTRAVVLTLQFSLCWHFIFFGTPVRMESHTVPYGK